MEAKCSNCGAASDTSIAQQKYFHDDTTELLLERETNSEPDCFLPKHVDRKQHDFSIISSTAYLDRVWMSRVQHGEDAQVGAQVGNRPTGGALVGDRKSQLSKRVIKSAAAPSLHAEILHAEPTGWREPQIPFISSHREKCRR